MSPDSSRLILPEPPGDLKRHSDRLFSQIAGDIEANGPMPFSRFMELALYAPGLGYYSAGLRKFGALGDFITAPELGPVFAQCLARQISQLAPAEGPFEILEIGAGTGQLASDLLTALGERAAPSRYTILERSADLKQRQQETLDDHAVSCGIQWRDEPPTEPWQGVVIANEVIDALPVDLFVLKQGQVFRRCVGLEGGQFAWLDQAAGSELRERVAATLPWPLEDYPQGYCSEICLTLSPWLQSVTRTLSKGCALFVDYGYSRREYYAPARHMGTLICHYRHRGHDDPLTWPGLQDISAFVDFTALAEAADDCDLDVAGYTSQAMFLIDCGLDEVMREAGGRPEKDRFALAAQVRELTLPEAMGEKFQVMALTRGMQGDLRGFRSLDLRHRL